eukprot:2396446-Prymnesium_polylepis.2
MPHLPGEGHTASRRDCSGARVRGTEQNTLARGKLHMREPLQMTTATTSASLGARVCLSNGVAAASEWRRIVKVVSANCRSKHGDARSKVHHSHLGRTARRPSYRTPSSCGRTYSDGEP